MQLLLVHERRGPATHSTAKSSHLIGKTLPKPPTTVHSVEKTEPNRGTQESNPVPQDEFYVQIGGQPIPYVTITPEMIKTMTQQERMEYIRVGKLMYRDVMVD